MFILFPYALRYSFSSLCRLHLQCFFQNINACIRIPVMNCMAFRALPDTNAQIFYPWISVAARAAGLTARIHRWYSVKFISIPAGFIFQHFEKLCPGNTCYGFSGSFPSRSDPRYRWFGFRAPASLTVSAGNHSADWLFSHALWLP